MFIMFVNLHTENMRHRDLHDDIKTAKHHVSLTIFGCPFREWPQAAWQHIHNGQLQLWEEMPYPEPSQATPACIGSPLDSPNNVSPGEAMNAKRLKLSDPLHTNKSSTHHQY